MKKEKNKELLRKLPSISKFIESKSGQKLSRKFGEGFTKYIARKQLEKVRKGILDFKVKALPSIAEISANIEKEILRMTTPEGRKAVNATGILLHTALGRAPYADNAKDSLSIFNGYSVLQAGLDDGKRCKRDGKVEEMLCELVGCEAATVVNNNAEATMLILNTLAKGKEAVISRGQLVEIGGSFRMPDVMKQSGAKMHEIGTTNRTHLKDYKAAVNSVRQVLLYTSILRTTVSEDFPAHQESRRFANFANQSFRIFL
jgi:L-seryl-tRNA(Ser) seleniumtransferase